MAIGNTLLYRQDFTGTTVTVTHNLDLRDVGYRVVCSGQSRSDLVQNMNFTEGDERNSFVINLGSYNEGHVQVLGGDIWSTNLPSPENNVKLDGLPQASGITDSYVTGATLNLTTLEIGRNGGLSDVTADLSSIDGTVKRVDGAGAVNGLTLTGSITTNGGLTLGGTLAINNGDWSGTDLSIVNGGTGQGTAQNAINSLSQVSSATNEHVLTKDTSTGNATWKAGGGGGTDTFVTGATLNSTTLELERNGGLADVTVDLSSIDTNTFVSGGTFNTTTDNIDFVGNSSDTTFSVDMGIIQHDRQSIDVSGSDITSSSYVDFTNSLTLTTGDLGTNGDYLITFNCYFDNNSVSQNWIILEISGSTVATVATTERMHEIRGNNQRGEDRIITLTHLATDVASGTVITVQGKTTAGTFGLHRGTLIIDGIRTTNNIS
jgi:hypothetical protein